MNFQATVWATTTCAVATETRGANGSANIDHLRKEQSVSLFEVPSGVVLIESDIVSRPDWFSAQARG